jgi:hypothetical protein
MIYNTVIFEKIKVDINIKRIFVANLKSFSVTPLSLNVTEKMFSIAVRKRSSLSKCDNIRSNKTTNF